MSHAGELFICKVCKEEHDQNEASMDDDYGGPCCEECRRNALWAKGWLKKKGMYRCLDGNDIAGNPQNAQRFKDYNV